MFNSQAPKSDDLPSSAQLVKSTIISAVIAGAILLTIVLPSEYGVDPTGMGSTLGLTAMGEIKVQLAEEAELDRKAQEKLPTDGQLKLLEGSSVLERIIREFGISAAYAQETRQDEVSVTLQPGEGTEVKMNMVKGAKANFTWTATDKVNFDLHGDGDGESTSYEKGRGVAQDNGVLEAAFNGNHGWFWRNRTSAPVTVTLKTDGAYTDIKQVR
jgi:hypothetical protein